MSPDPGSQPPPPNGMVPHPPPIPHTFCARHCNETYISIFLHARRCSETHIFILLDEPSRRIRWVDRAKLWRNANFKLQELLRAVYRTFQCSANGHIYIYRYISIYIHNIHKNRQLHNKYIHIIYNYIYIDKYIRIYIYTYSICIYTYTYTCTYYTYTYTYYTYIHIHIYIYIHTSHAATTTTHTTGGGGAIQTH